MRFRAVLLGIFSVLALLLACLGVYGVLSFLVSHRTREIGVRMTLGASRGQLLFSFVAKGTAMVGLGAALGLLASIAMTRLLTVFLFEVEPLDPLTLALAVSFLLASAALACYLPARRALRVDPAAALRQE